MTAALPLHDYALLDDDACDARIVATKAKLGNRCIILGHH